MIDQKLLIVQSNHMFKNVETVIFYDLQYTSVNSNTQGTMYFVRIIGIKTRGTWEFVRNNEKFELSGIRVN